MFDIITIGDATFDTFIIIENDDAQVALRADKKELCLNFADKICITDTDQSLGGNASNVAVATQKIGLHTAIVTELGDDPNGAVILQGLKSAGVDTSLVKMLKKKVTRFSIVLNYKSERTILSYYAKRSYTFPHLPDTKWIYYTSLGKSFTGVQQKLEQHLKRHGDIQLACNPGSYQLKNGLETIKKILPRTEILFVNVEEAQKIVGKKLPTAALLSSLIARGVHKAVITDSTRGSYASDGTDTFFMPAYPIVPLAKTGAGDAYASGFLAATIHGKSIQEAMQWGTANAGGVIQKVGAHKGLLTQAGIRKILKAFPKVLPKRI